MGIYKHSNSLYWYYTFTVNGKRISEGTQKVTKTLAREIYEARRVRGQNRTQTKERIPLSDMAEDFLQWSKANKKSYRRYVTMVNHLLNFFRGKDIGDISGLDVERYKQKRKKEVKPATVNRREAFDGGLRRR